MGLMEMDRPHFYSELTRTLQEDEFGDDLVILHASSSNLSLINEEVYFVIYNKTIPASVI